MLYDLLEEKTENRWEHRWIRRPLTQKEVLPIMVKFAGYARWKAGMEVGRWDSDLFAVEYVCAGDTVFIQDGKKSIIGKGEVYLLRRHAKHTYRPGETGILFKRYLTIYGVGLENMLRLLNLWDKDHIVPKEPGKIRHLLKRATTLISNPGLQDLDTELSIIAYHLLLLLGQSVSARFPEPVERALAIMHENLHRSLSRKEICEYAMTSPAQLNRLFAAHLHKTPMGYFLDLKLSWAATMLDSTRMSVKEIAYRIGFENQFSFSSQFKNHYGMSPKEFRESRTEADKNAITQN